MHALSNSYVDQVKVKLRNVEYVSRTLDRKPLFVIYAFASSYLCYDSAD